MLHDADGDAVEVVIARFWWRAHLDDDDGGGGEPSGSDGDWDGVVVCGCGIDGDCSGFGVDTAGGGGSGKIGRIGDLLESSRLVLLLLIVFGKVGFYLG